MTNGLIRITLRKWWIFSLPFILFAFLFLFFSKTTQPTEAQPVSCSFEATSATTVDPGQSISFKLTTFSPGTSYVVGIYSPTSDISKANPLATKLFTATSLGQVFTLSFKMEFGQGALMAAAGPWDGTSDTPINIQCSGSPIDLYVNLQPSPAPTPTPGCRLADWNPKTGTVNTSATFIISNADVTSKHYYGIEIRRNDKGEITYTTPEPGVRADSTPLSINVPGSAFPVATTYEIRAYDLSTSLPTECGNRWTFTVVASDPCTLSGPDSIVEGEGAKVTLSNVQSATYQIKVYFEIDLSETYKKEVSSPGTSPLNIDIPASAFPGKNFAYIVEAFRKLSTGEWVGCSNKLRITVAEKTTPTPPPPGEIKTGLGTIPTEPGRLAKGILAWGTGIVGGIAFLMMLYGGFLILTSGGHPENLALGREVFTAAVVGLLFVLFAVWLMRFLGGALPIPGIG